MSLEVYSFANTPSTTDIIVDLIVQCVPVAIAALVVFAAACFIAAMAYRFAHKGENHANHD